MQATTQKFTPDLYKAVIEMRNAGKTLHDISRFLDRNQIKSKKGGRFTEGGVSNVLKRASRETGIPVRKFGVGRPKESRVRTPQSTTSKIAVDRDFYVQMILKADHLGATKQVQEIKGVYGVA